MDLKLFTDDFLYKFSKYIEEDNRIKSLWRAIYWFVQFRNNNNINLLKCEG